MSGGGCTGAKRVKLLQQTSCLTSCLPNCQLTNPQALDRLLTFLQIPGGSFTQGSTGPLFYPFYALEKLAATINLKANARKFRLKPLKSEFCTVVRCSHSNLYLYLFLYLDLFLYQICSLQIALLCLLYLSVDIINTRNTNQLSCLVSVDIINTRSTNKLSWAHLDFLCDLLNRFSSDPDQWPSWPSCRQHNRLLGRIFTLFWVAF